METTVFQAHLLKKWLGCLISDSTKTIRLLALYFYEMIVSFGFALIKYHFIEIWSS